MLHSVKRCSQGTPTECITHKQQRKYKGVPLKCARNDAHFILGYYKGVEFDSLRKLIATLLRVLSRMVACELETRALSASGFNPDSVAVALAGVKMAALAAS
jgi:hypothetical protein|nr:MAG TPA: hypothetical protein [Microviridae sp.]